jgi:hypothetical protein
MRQNLVEIVTAKLRVRKVASELKMKRFAFIVLLMVARLGFSQILPSFSIQPTNLIVSPGATATFTVIATGATSYQWRQNGVDISGATNATIQISNAQTNKNGYYLAIARNSTGWVPSQMAYLSVVGTNGLLPLSNLFATGQVVNGSGAPGIVSSQAQYGSLAFGGAQVWTGPQLDVMLPLTPTATVSNGIYDYHSVIITNRIWLEPFDPINGDYNFGPDGTTLYRYNDATSDYDILVSYLTFTTTPAGPVALNVAAGQSCFYRVQIVETNRSNGGVYSFPSTMLSVTAGGNGSPLPDVTAIKFPVWIEWPEPVIENFYYGPNSPVVQTRVPSETFSLVQNYSAYTDLGIPHGQWRKDGRLISGATNYIEGQYYHGTATLSLTNFQPADAGVYDFVLYGNNWIIGPKIYLSIQITNGLGMLQKPKIAGTNFVCGLAGAAGRNYQVQQSTNLVNWSNLTTLSNSTGIVMFTNSAAGSGARFYRTVLLP